LRSCSPELREELLRTLLDVLRRSLAVKVDVLDPQKQLDLVEQTKPRLLEDTVWYLEDARELEKFVVAYPQPQPKQQQDRTGSFVSSYDTFRECLLVGQSEFSMSYRVFSTLRDRLREHCGCPHQA
jgi:uncharacterized iron-regulated membrane protein